jgi:iron complex transport system permease protein
MPSDRVDVALDDNAQGQARAGEPQPSQQSGQEGGQQGQHVRRRPLAVVLLMLSGALVFAVLAAISIGTVNLPLGDVWIVVAAHLSGRAATTDHGGALDPLQNQIVWDLRTPRVLLAAVIGAALAAAGVALQGLVRNPLADPYVLGVSSGASLGAVLVLTFGAGAAGGLSVAGAAFVGALGTLVLVYVLAQRAGRLTAGRLILSGVAISYLAGAGTSLVQLHANPNEIRGILFWLMGSVAGAAWSDLGVPAAAMVACTGWLLLQHRGLNALAVGDDDAAALGVDVHRLRIGLLVAASLLTATAVAVAGGVGFIGLMVPHAARLVVGADHRRLLPVATLAGAVFLVLVDLATRAVDRPNEYPISVFTAAIGAPFFLWLLRGSPGSEAGAA